MLKGGIAMGRFTIHEGPNGSIYVEPFEMTEDDVYLNVTRTVRVVELSSGREVQAMAAVRALDELVQECNGIHERAFRWPMPPHDMLSFSARFERRLSYSGCKTSEAKSLRRKAAKAAVQEEVETWLKDAKSKALPAMNAAMARWIENVNAKYIEAWENRLFSASDEAFAKSDVEIAKVMARISAMHESRRAISGLIAEQRKRLAELKRGYVRDYLEQHDWIVPGSGKIPPHLRGKFACKLDSDGSAFESIDPPLIDP